jgi:hypothetical protein
MKNYIFQILIPPEQFWRCAYNTSTALSSFFAITLPSWRFYEDPAVCCIPSKLLPRRSKGKFSCFLAISPGFLSSSYPLFVPLLMISSCLSNQPCLFSPHSMVPNEWNIVQNSTNSVRALLSNLFNSYRLTFRFKCDAFKYVTTNSANFALSLHDTVLYITKRSFGVIKGRKKEFIINTENGGWKEKGKVYKSTHMRKIM